MSAFLLGGLNTLPDGKVCALCLAHGLVDLTRNIPVTFYKFGEREPGIKLDCIFTDPATAARSCSVRVWDECVNGIYLSDHYPIELTCDQ